MFTFAILRNAPKQTSEQASIQFVQLVFFVGNFPIELLMRLVFGIPAPHSRHTNGRASVYIHCTDTRSPLTIPKESRKEMRRNIAFISNDS